ncbi:MAG: ABC transporter ATP-binding protein [Burkholderiales bacterium]
MSVADNSALLSVRNIQRSFRGLRVLKDVQFDIAPHSFAGLIGPNGAGKSTLFNIISGFLKPTSGSMTFDGTDISPCSVQERSRRGLVRTFQTPQIFGGMTVLENLMVGLHKNSRSGITGNLFLSRRSRREYREAYQAATSALDRFGLAHVGSQNAQSLPGGLQRMLELARAYLGKPRLLMLDEPSSGLNNDEIGQLTQALHQLNAEGITILLVSHDMELVRAASIIHVLCFGEIIATGPLAAIQQNARVREAYLGA